MTFPCHLLGMLLLLSSCAVPEGIPLRDHALVYCVDDRNELIQRFAPVFLIEQAEQDYNRIGTVEARIENGDEIVEVNPESSTLYTSRQNFSTDKGSYTNLLYRVHFKEVPFGFVPFYLGAGQNVGLIVIVTLDDCQRPLLYTLVHTCGCYLAFIPTSHLAQEKWRKDWPAGRQYVYGENLPALLVAAQQADGHFTILIRTATHRVKDVWFSTEDELLTYKQMHSKLMPVESLESLSVSETESTSFFETSGPRLGYVKGSQKIWERILISWWAFDWRVGEDKKLGRDSGDGIVFYTSLKPWARESSDLRDFARFLRYWGWRL